MTNNCETVTIGQPLQDWQKEALTWVSFFRGRDVVFAIDLTESVGFNDQGRVRLRQIVSDSLSKGDRVYVIPFANEVNPTETVIEFQKQTEDIEKILSIIPFQKDSNLSNTDIQKAELFIYKQLAQINQCRMLNNEPIKAQSIVWITDAPLDSVEPWIETPFTSPFRNPNSSETQARIDWLNVLSRKSRSLNISQYELTVVDIPPTVQEICTPTPGGKESCLVTNYLIKQLWLPATIFTLLLLGSLIGGSYGINYWLKLSKTWQITVNYTQEDETEKLSLKNGEKIAIGGGGINSIHCPGEEIRGYLQRQGNQLFLLPNTVENSLLEINGRSLTKKEIISQCIIRLNCTDIEYEMNIKIVK